MNHLYIHIPFCQRRCAYCDFNTYANMEHRIAAYVDALCAELALLAAEFGDHMPAYAPLRPTIFFGGGTPTMLSLAQFERVLRAADTLVPLAAAEVTCEANPGTLLDSAYLRGLRALGVNRLSMGVQSLHDPTLRLLGRIHSAAEARRSYEDARTAGFASINLDFIFGLPGQSLAQWEQTLAEVATWAVDHFSLYSLVLEESTPLYAQVTAGRVGLPDDDDAAAMYEAAIARLDAAGYTQYEISNWAVRRPDDAEQRPAAACAHNLAYWFNLDYLAAGAGAHGHVFPQRYHNLRAIDDYICAVRKGTRPIAETIALDAQDRCAETMFMGLRLNAGVSRAHFAQRCASELDMVYGGTLRELVVAGLLEDDGAVVRLSTRGRMFGNQVFAHFV